MWIVEAVRLACGDCLPVADTSCSSGTHLSNATKANDALTSQVCSSNRRSRRAGSLAEQLLSRQAAILAFLGIAACFCPSPECPACLLAHSSAAAAVPPPLQQRWLVIVTVAATATTTVVLEAVRTAATAALWLKLCCLLQQRLLCWLAACLTWSVCHRWRLLQRSRTLSVACPNTETSQPAQLGPACRV